MKPLILLCMCICMASCHVIPVSTTEVLSFNDMPASAQRLITEFFHPHDITSITKRKADKGFVVSFGRGNKSALIRRVNGKQSTV